MSYNCVGYLAFWDGLSSFAVNDRNMDMAFFFLIASCCVGRCSVFSCSSLFSWNWCVLKRDVWFFIHYLEFWQWQIQWRMDIHAHLLWNKTPDFSGTIMNSCLLRMDFCLAVNCKHIWMWCSNPHFHLKQSLRLQCSASLLKNNTNEKHGKHVYLWVNWSFQEQNAEVLPGLWF